MTAFAACGGGGGGGGSNAAPAAPVTGTGTPSVTFTLTIPNARTAAGARARQSVSPGTQSFVVALDSVNGVAQTASVETNIGSSACVAVTDGTACSVQIAAPAGTDVFTVTLYAGTGATGAVLGSVTAPETIAANGTNSITLTVNGVIASLSLALAPATGVVGTAQTAHAAVVALDATGAAIVAPGAYAAPVTVASSDAGGHVLVAVNGGTPARSVQLASPQDVLAVVYDGLGSAQSAAIAASTTGVAPATATFAVVNPLVLTPAAIAFTQLGAAGAQTVAVTGGVPPYLVNGTATSAAGAPIAYSVSGATIAVTASGGAIETLTVSDAIGEAVPLSVTSITLTVPIQ